ncbi:cation:proton antiporter subunit C [Tistrella sp. BH-R2-4]|jgi:multicomponent Na+:H+ antiporter subunit C|uniref:Cation:proton antiporter subunit C n=1 Tax=Tistrella arctica TaxID=3133430 RepID=A0ABU9YIZ5_9PROT
MLGHFNYWVSIILMMTGFYAVIASTNMVKKLIGLGMFQTAVFLLYISIGKVRGGTAPILIDGVAAGDVSFSNPLTHVLILTAIVVSIATTALGLAIVVRIRESYGCIEEDETIAMDMADERAEDAMPPTIADAKRRLGWLPRGQSSRAQAAPRLSTPAQTPDRAAGTSRPLAPRKGPTGRRKSAPRKGKSRP